MLLGKYTQITQQIRLYYKTFQPSHPTKKEATLTGTWDIGKKILYTLTLPAGAEELTFTAQADGWTNEDPQPSPIEPNK